MPWRLKEIINFELEKEFNTESFFKVLSLLKLMQNMGHNMFACSVR